MISSQKILLGTTLVFGLAQAVLLSSINQDFKSNVLNTDPLMTARTTPLNALLASATTPFNPANYPAQFFNQLLNHRTRRTFKQRYYVNADHYKPGGPVFVHISGEQAARSKSVGGLERYLAEQHNGIVYSLEHRFYGVSHPFDQLNSTTLRYLTSDYALKDLANFISKVKDPLTNKPFRNNKRYVVGGSYAGSMAAWMRQSYPWLIDGAVASSGPILAKEEFFEYDLSVGTTLGDKCLSAVNEVTSFIDDLYAKKDERFHSLKEKLGCSKIEDDRLFLYTISDTLAMLVQYNNPNKTPNVESFCQGFQNTTASIEDKLNFYLDTLSQVMTSNGQDCLAASYQTELYDSGISEYGMMKQWNYQSCTEFGFWQTAPTPAQSNQLSSRSKFLTKDFFNSFFCSEKVFGTKVGPPKVDAINHKRGGLDIETNRIIFTNGDQDPWTKLSRADIENSRPNRPILIIKNGSHVNDLNYPGPNALPSVQEVQEVIIETIAKWVNER